MSDLLKEAIADAKAVRETALANAKMALEEAFTPRLQSILSKKLTEEAEADDDEDSDDGGDDDSGDDEEKDEVDEELKSSGIGTGEENKEPDSDAKTSSGIGSNSSNKPSKPVGPTGGELNEADDEDDDSDEEEEEDGLDLDEIIAELEAELSEGDDEEEKEDDSDDSDDSDDDDEKEDVDEGDEPYEDDDPEGSAPNVVDEEEEVDLDEILQALSEIELDSTDENELDELRKENQELKDRLSEFEDAVIFMKDKLNEVNLLNAKLLYSNKLFRAYDLTNEQKKRVIETLDRTGTVREVKLVFSTLAESLKMTDSPKRKNTTSLTEGLASKPVGSTKPASDDKEIISEEVHRADRWKYLAGIKN